LPSAVCSQFPGFKSSKIFKKGRKLYLQLRNELYLYHTDSCSSKIENVLVKILSCRLQAAEQNWKLYTKFSKNQE